MITVPPQAAKAHTNWRLQGWHLLLHLVLLVGGLAGLLPFLWMVSTSLKNQDNIISFPPQLIPDPFTWTNYNELFTVVPMLRYLLNTVGVVSIIAVGQVISSSLAAYAFARLKFRGRDVLFMAYLGTMMIPSQVTLIPSFILMKYLHWINTYAALTIPFMFGSAFGTFLIRQSFLGIPGELEDAARIDGCGYLRLYAQIAVPLAKPALTTFGVFSFLYFWNDFLWELIVTNSQSHMTLQVGLATLATSYYGTNWGDLMGGTVVSVIPLLLVFLFAQRYFLQGITMTGLKG